MINGKTKSGFKFSIDERVMDDWRLLKSIALSESSDPSEQIKGASNLVTLLLGDQEPAMMEFIAKKNKGFVPATAVTEMVTEILTSVKELKNSSSSEG
jgi:hypothetical protein